MTTRLGAHRKQQYASQRVRLRKVANPSPPQHTAPRLSRPAPAVSSPARFSMPRLLRRKRLLIVGCGACGLHIARQKARSWRILATTTQASNLAALRAAGVIPLRIDLDQPSDRRRRWTGLATALIVLVPPPTTGLQDTRIRRLAQLLRQQPRTIVALRAGPARPRLVYISTSGVYGNADGRWLTETAPLRPQSDRAKRRVDAETALKTLGQTGHWSVNILRAPGIYGQDRLPLQRLTAGTPCIEADDDSYSNHISDIDLARSALMALHRGRSQRVFNANDDQPMKIGAYFDAVADACGLTRPPRAPRDTVKQQLTPMQWSFLQESRRLSNRRLREELRLRLRYPSVQQALAEFFPIPPSS